MSVRRFVAPLVVLALLAVPSTSVQGAEPEPGKFIGLDGITYGLAPPVVTGTNGDLYPGWELDFACRLGGKRLAKSITQIGKLAALLEKSGRRVVYTVAPGKTWGLSRHLDPATLPHGSCDSIGVAQQNEALDQARPSYLPLLPLLASRKHEMYWKTDPHWSTVGASRYARGLAAALDPKLGRQQRYTYTNETRWGNLAEANGDPTPEVVERAIPNYGIKVRTAKGAPEWDGYPSITFDTSWVSSPSKRTWPGRTVLIGDSFLWYALESLRPVFRQGRFLWLGHTEARDVLSSIVHADTVVLEAYGGFGSIFGLASFRRAVRKALAKHPRPPHGSAS